MNLTEMDIRSVICVCFVLVVLYSCYKVELVSKCAMDDSNHEKIAAIQYVKMQPKARPPT